MNETEKMELLLEKMTPKMADFFINEAEITPEEKDLFLDFLEYLNTPEGTRVFIENMKGSD